MTNKQVPSIRFAGFTDAWEQRKLGEYCTYRRGSFPQPYGNKEWYDGDESKPFVQVVDVSNNLKLVKNTKQKISKKAQAKSIFVPKGKVIVTLQGSIGRVAITQYDAYVDRTILIFEDYSRETNEFFWAYVIQNKFKQEKIKAPGGTIKTITKEALSGFDVSIPNTLEEQTKIGNFFKQLDDTITVHQHELDLLKEQKKGFLQKMFPKKDEVVPEIRFAGFNDAWEQRKLKDVSTYFNGGSFENDVTDEGKYQLVTLKSVNTDGELVGSERYINTKAPTLMKNTLVMILSEQAPGLLGMTAVIPENNKYVLNQRVAEILPNKDLDSYFLSKSINNNQIYFSKRGAGTKVQNISKPNVENFELYVPQYEEQTKIGNFFKQLDDTIALHQRELEELKEMKKGFLQKMFV